MRRLVILPRAEREWDNTYSYLARRFSPSEATSIEDKLFEVIRDLGNNPGRGVSRVMGGVEIYRILFNGLTYIYYSFDAEALTVHSLFHGRRNPKKRLY